jgi:hypothetical protein
VWAWGDEGVAGDRGKEERSTTKVRMELRCEEIQTMGGCASIVRWGEGAGGRKGLEG